MTLFQKKTWVLSSISLATIFVIIRISTPNHPYINHNASIKEVKTAIQEILQTNIRNLKLQYLDSSSGGMPVKYIKATNSTLANLSACKEDKLCMIKVYDSYMSDYSSDSLRREYRAYYMIQKFGLVGEQFNKMFGFLY